MKTSSILLSIALAFQTVYSKAINNKILPEQLNGTDNSFELVESDNFIYKLHCSEEYDCDKFKNDLNFAFTTLSNTFEIYEPIVFEVFVDDLITKYKINALAAVLDSNYVPLKTSGNDAPYLYPQALVKQLKLNKQPKYKKNDFIMVLDNGKANPQSESKELRRLIVHEIFHGLGFMSLAAVKKLTDNDVYNIYNPGEPIQYNETDKYAILPYTVPSFSEKLLDITDGEKYMDQLINTEISKFMPFSVFDKNIVSLKSGEKLFGDLEFYYKEASQKCLPKNGSPLLLKESTDKKISDCFESLSSETQEIITRNIRDHYFEAQTLGILTEDGDTVPLQTMGYLYAPGSSVSHIANPLYDLIFTKLVQYGPEAIRIYYDEATEKLNKGYVLEYYDDNYILYFSDEDNLTLDEMLQLLPNNKNHPLIGDGIIKIMKTLGWTEKGKQKSNETYYLDESIDIPESNNFEYMFKRRYEI